MTVALREGYIAALDTVAALAERNYSDYAPDKAQLPYTVTRLDIGVTPALQGDGSVLALTRLNSTELWESRTNEDDAVRIGVFRALNNLKLANSFVIVVRSIIRVPDPNYDLVHRSFTTAAIQKAGF